MKIINNNNPDPIPPYQSKCKRCGHLNTAQATYHETVYGTCDIVDLQTLEMEGYDVDDSGGLTIDMYVCGHCGEDSYNPVNLFQLVDAEGRPVEYSGVI